MKINLVELRTVFNQNKIILCFNGPMSRSLIVEIGSALKNYLQAEQTIMSSAMDIFGIYIEMSQNIRHYAQKNNYDDVSASATIIVARNDENHYLVQAGNIIKKSDSALLLKRINELANMSDIDLKAAYKKQLREPRPECATTGAGLGLIDIARKSSKPLSAKVSPIDDETLFFSLCATV